MKECKEAPVLFESAKECCGCGSCVAACPQSAITMEENAQGFIFPRIDESMCVGCGVCMRVCGFHSLLGENTKGPWYASAGTGDVSDSASGGVFATIARSVIDADGCAFGAAYEPFEGGLHVRHRMAEDEKSLVALLNSKYVQSDAGTCFSEVKQQLKRGRLVFFCGTPCQVSGIRGFLSHDYSNLLTADLVCHGVPSEKMFNGWVQKMAKKYGAKVVDFRFRCKREGWGHSLLLLLLLSDGREMTIPAPKCSYYDMFLKLKTLRDSCYACPYAGSFRAGDITLGDFWGIEKNCPQLLEDDKLSLERGISCLLVNNARGRELLERFGSNLVLKEAPFTSIAKGNDQLRHPAVVPADRHIYLDAFKKGGWRSIECEWKHRERGIAYQAKLAAGHLLPKSLKTYLKSHFSL